MELLTEENDKLKEAMNLIERNIQRAQRKQDLTESNARDLEYQKDVLSEQLVIMSEQLCNKSEQLSSASKQLERKSEQLRNVFEQKAEQDAKLGQLRQAIEQLREEKVKDLGQADKMAKELNGEYFLVGVIAGVISWLNGFL
ncbi:tropomyosin-like [Miscanthus floridulus]|uniref:tropomyosin-like n=1 Tax=Miscanthus floridulus TaxID=154761 RepID=UPI00345AFF97